MESKLFFLLLLFVSCKGTQEMVDSNQTVNTDQLFDIAIINPENNALDLNELKNNIANVYMFLSPDCPICQRYPSKLVKLFEEYHDSNIGFIGVFPGELAKPTLARMFQQNYNMNIPIMLDSEFIVTKLLNAKVTPEVFVVKNNGNVLYSGRIDNWFESLGKKRNIVSDENLKDALNSLINNTALKTVRTEPVGCIIYSPEK